MLGTSFVGWCSHDSAIGKTQWNRGGFEPPGHAALLEVARMADPEAKLWLGDLEDRLEERGIRVLGTPLGSDEFVTVQLQLTVDSHPLLLDRIPVVQDLQSAWFLLLFCAVSRYLRVCRPSVRTSLLTNMMPRFGSVWLFLAMTHPIQCGRWGVCPCTWGALGCEVLFAQLPQLSGVGLIVWTQSASVMRTSPTR